MQIFTLVDDDFLEVFEPDFHPIPQHDPDVSLAEEYLRMTTTTKKRGFGSMTPARVREIASKGGKSVPAEKRSFSINPELARIAGTKGGKANGHSAHVR